MLSQIHCTTENTKSFFLNCYHSQNNGFCVVILEHSQWCYCILWTSWRCSVEGVCLLFFNLLANYTSIGNLWTLNAMMTIWLFSLQEKAYSTFEDFKVSSTAGLLHAIDKRNVNIHVCYQNNLPDISYSKNFAWIAFSLDFRCGYQN